MIPILYEKDEIVFAYNGLGRLRDCVSCIVTEERNGIYECDFEYPITGQNFDKIQIGRIIAVEHDDTGNIQPFDIVSYERPIDGVVTFHATHISYRQSYLTVNGTNINSLAAAFSLLESSAEPSNPFTYDTDKSSVGYVGALDGVPKTVRSILGGTEGSILDAYGGEYEFDLFRVILHSQRGQYRDFAIRYGVNMTDYTDETDSSSCYSSCIPYWTDGTTTVVGDKQTSGGVTPSGRDECIPLDVSERFENQPTKADVNAAGLAVMNSAQPFIPAQTITVSFIRLQDAGEFAQFSNLLRCNLCDTIRVIFPDYNSSGMFKIVRTVWDVLGERYEEMELGDLSISLSDALGISDIQRDSKSTIEQMQSDIDDLKKDYIVDENTSGSWQYRKWNSGKREAWFQGNITCSATESTGSIYRSTYSLSIPSGIFSAAPKISMDIDQNAATVFGINGTASSSTAIAGRVFRSTTSTSTYTLTVFVYAVQN